MKKIEEDDSIITTGFVQGKELQELYSNAYLYVLPSDIEGMPMSLLEALSYGNACLVSDIPENTEVINEETGMPVFIAEEPDKCVVKGVGMALDNIEVLKKATKIIRHFFPFSPTFLYCLQHNLLA